MRWGEFLRNIVLEARNQLEHLSKQDGLRTAEVRYVSSKLFKTLEDKNINQVFTLCESLLDERDWALDVIAYDWAFRVRKQYNQHTFLIFEEWLKKYVRGWGDCDDFCTHAFGELLCQDNNLFTEIIKWTEHPDFFVRRAAAVILIYPIRRQKFQKINPFLISDALMHDDHHLVLKGYGWMLKVLSETESKKVYEYLKRKKHIMPRIALRYALEKLDKELKLELMEG